MDRRKYYCDMLVKKKIDLFIQTQDQIPRGLPASYCPDKAPVDYKGDRPGWSMRVVGNDPPRIACGVELKKNVFHLNLKGVGDVPVLPVTVTVITAVGSGMLLGTVQTTVCSSLRTTWASKLPNVTLTYFLTVVK